MAEKSSCSDQGIPKEQWVMLQEGDVVGGSHRFWSLSVLLTTAFSCCELDELTLDFESETGVP